MTVRVERHGAPIHSGLGIPFESVDTKIGRITSILFSRPTPTASVGLLSTNNIRNVFYRTSPEYLRAFQQELQRVLIHAFNNRENVSDELFSLFVHQTLSIFPFAYPEEGFNIQVPIKVGENWELKSYQLDKKFNLGNGVLLSPMPSYGFKSVTGGPPLLVFMGTTYPAGEGFLGTLFSNFTPGVSVGGLPLLYQGHEIGEWLQANSGAHVMGISLGGALSLHAARHFGEHISQVFAYMSPGLCQNELGAFENSTTQINLLFQDNDFVSNVGFFPEGENVNLYHVYEEERANCLSAHARVYLSGENIEVFSGSVEYENQKISRKILTALHKIFSPLLFLILLPTYLTASLFTLLCIVFSQISTIVFPGCSRPRFPEAIV